MARFINIIALLLLVSVSYSQSPSLEFKAKYQQAKINLKNNNIEQAKKAFEYLISTPQNSYTPYLYYYLAMAQHKLNDYNECENTLEQISSKYTLWALNDDYYYLTGINYLKKNEIEKSLTFLNKIKNKDFENKISSNIISNIKPEILEKNLKTYILKYPNITALKNLNQLNYVRNVYGDNTKSLPKLPPIQQTFINNKINVGLLLPFGMDSLNHVNKNQYAYDLYDGIQIAVEKLAKEGVEIYLHAYDIGNSQAKLLELINNKSFNKENLLFGPLHIESNKMAQYYANELHIPLVNPLSKSTDLVSNKKYCFLANGSNNAYAKAVIKYLQSNYFGEIGIIYGANAEDKIAMNGFETELIKNKTKYSTLKYSNTESINSWATKKLSCILLCCQPSQANQILNSIDKKLGAIPIITNSNSVTVNNQINNTELYIFNQNFIDEENENILAFKIDFWNKKNTIPSEYTYKGYDMMLFWGRQLAKYKENAADMLRFKSIDDDFLLSGFDYSLQNNENSAYIITTVQRGREIFFKK